MKRGTQKDTPDKKQKKKKKKKKKREVSTEK